MAKETDAKITVKKDDDFSEWFTQLMQKAELADVRYSIKGFPVYMPWAVKSIQKIKKLWEDELEAHDHQPLLLPLLIPESNLTKEADHIEGFTPSVFWVTEAGDGKKFEERYALRPTSETVMYEMFGKWIQSHNDLPFKRYQSVNVFRYETKMTRPFLRTREIHWTEAHNVFATEEDAYNQVKEDMKITYDLLYGKMALPHIFFKRPQWDKFPGAINTFAADMLLPSGKVLQLPSTHMISQDFSKAFDVQYTDADGSSKPGWITCYGPAHSRNYGALIVFHGDDKGLVLPWDIAPEQIVVVPILFKDAEEKVTVVANDIFKKLQTEKYLVRLDNRKDTTPGRKFNEWEMKGVPVRIEIGPKDVDNNVVTVFRRDLGTKETVPQKDLSEYIADIKKTFTANLRKKADESIAQKTKDCTTMEEIKEAIESGMMVRTCVYSIGKDAIAMAETVEKDINAEIRGEWFEKNEKVFCKCPFTGKEGKHVVYIARSY